MLIVKRFGGSPAPAMSRSTLCNIHDILLGELIMFVYFDIFFQAFFAAVLLLLISDSGCCTFPSSDYFSVLGVMSAPCSHLKRAIVSQWVCLFTPVDVRTLAALMWPSFPLIRSTTTASFHFILGLSS